MRGLGWTPFRMGCAVGGIFLGGFFWRLQKIDFDLPYVARMADVL